MISSCEQDAAVVLALTIINTFITKTKLKSCYFLKASKPHITAYEFYGRAMPSSWLTKPINSSGVN